MIKHVYTLNTMTDFFFSFFFPKALVPFQFTKRDLMERGGQSAALFPVLSYFIIYDCSLDAVGYVCSLYPKRSREGQEFLDVQLFLKTFVYHTILSFDYI